MELSPADLGDTFYVALIRQRTGVPQTAIPRTPRMGKLGRRWVRGLDLSPEMAARTLPLSGQMTGGIMGGMLGGFGWLPLIGAIIAAASGGSELAAITAASAAGLGWLGIDYLPRRVVHHLHRRPLGEGEVHKIREAFAERNGLSSGQMPPDFVARLSDQLQTLFGSQTPNSAGAMRDPQAGLLENDFWILVGDVVRTTIAAPESADELRRTLKLLGNAVSDLPLPPGTGSEEATDLLADAEMLVARARREPDRVIADSLVRQAEAKAAQATAVENAVRLTRRTRVLREELRAQIAATRAALPTLSQVGANVPTTTLRRVAASVQAVAREAASVVAAREELAETLGEHWHQAVASDAEETVPNYTTVVQTDDNAPPLRLGRR